MVPTFPIKTFLLLIIPVALAAIILAVVGKRGTGVFKKQGVAWGLTVLMIFAAIGIGYAKAPVSNPAHSPDYPPETAPPAAAESYVWDDAGVLSSQTVRVLDQRNERLWKRYNAVVGVALCNYGGNDPYTYVTTLFADMGLGGDDMLVVLDISGDNYWMYTGERVSRQFSGEDCDDYTYGYMEDFFARGMYDDAVLALTEALEVWYADYYG